MSEELAGESPDLDAWMLLQQTRYLIFRREDAVLTRLGLTTEQYTVLLAIERLDAPVRITDVAQSLGRSTNGVSMLVDRMVKAGLVERMRDVGDRREVHVVMTAKGEQTLRPAKPAVSQLIQDIWSSLPRDDRRTFIRLLDILRDKARSTSSGPDIRETERQ
jgi:DNA-binding MarR family transcriptional regulator